jgi:hypothetical protein
MALIDEINRDYPFQVRFSLDDRLDWLYGRLGCWDMYVDRAGSGNLHRTLSGVSA